MGIKEDTLENRSFLQNVSDESWYDLHGSTQYAYVQLARKIESREGVNYLKRFKIGPRDGPVTLEEKRTKFWASRDSAPSRGRSRKVKKESSSEDDNSSDKASVSDEKGDKNTELSTKFIEQTIQVMNLQKDKLTLEERVRNLENSLEDMKQEQASYKEQISTLQQEQQVHKERISTMEGQISKLQQSKVDLANQLFSAKHKIGTLEHSTERLHEEIQFYRREVDSKNKFIESHLALIAQNTNEILRKQNRRLSL
jgi:chromosome segregation ATPase